MAVNELNYGEYSTLNGQINTCIQNIENELNVANAKLHEATDDASGRWASTDIADWEGIYSDINVKFQRMQELMKASGVATQETSATENAYAGFRG